MSPRFRHKRTLLTAAALLLAAPLATMAAPARPAAAASLTTAWQNGSFSVNPAGVVSRSDIVLGQPNTAASQSLPLSNGSLGRRRLGGRRVHRAAEPQRHHAEPAGPRAADRSPACRR